MAVRSGAIVIGGYINGLGVIRALAAQRIPIAVIVTKPYDLAQHSRWVSSATALLDLDENPAGLLNLLEQRAREWSGWALVPTTDGALAALAHYRDRLAATYRVIAPPAEVADYFLDKSRMLDAAQAVGVDLPLCYGPADSATAARVDLRFPVVVKPRVGYRFMAQFGVKLFVAHDHEDLRRAVEQLQQVGLDGHVFDLIPGPDSQIIAYCTYIDQTGEPRAGLTIRKMRQSPPLFGVARAAHLVEDDTRVREATVAILQRMGFRGMAAAEFKIDPRDGRIRFLEVNGRSVIYNALLRKGGLDLAGMAWSEHVHGSVPAQARSGWPGCWVNVHADLLYSVLYRRQAPVSLREFLAAYRRPIVEAIWSPSDPLPFLTQWTRSARQAAAAIWGGTLGDVLAQHHPHKTDAPSMSASHLTERGWRNA